MHIRRYSYNTKACVCEWLSACVCVYAWRWMPRCHTTAHTRDEKWGEENSFYDLISSMRALLLSFKLGYSFGIHSPFQCQHLTFRGPIPYNLYAHFCPQCETIWSCSKQLFNHTCTDVSARLSLYRQILSAQLPEWMSLQGLAQPFHSISLHSMTE